MDSLGLSLLFALISIIALTVVCCLIHYIAKARRRLCERRQVEGKTGSPNDEPDVESLAASTRASVISLASAHGMQEPCQVSAMIQTPKAVHSSNPFDQQRAESASKEVRMVRVLEPQLPGTSSSGSSEWI